MPTNPVSRVQSKKEKVKNQIEELRQQLFSLDREEVYATQLTELCPDCKGSCQERYTDAAGSGDWRDCSTCKGWGYVTNGIKCPECGKNLDDMNHLRRQNMPNCPFCGRYLGQLFKEVVR